MPVPQRSRFAGLPVLEVTAPDGTRCHVIGLRLTSTAAAGELTHLVQQGEDIDAIAGRRLGDEQLWWQLLDANPLRYPLDLVPGERLHLPEPSRTTQAIRARRF
jgi:hypothetical protein